MSPKGEHKLSKANESYSFVIEEIVDTVALCLSDIYSLILDHLRKLFNGQKCIVIGVCILEGFLQLKKSTSSLGG